MLITELHRIIKPGTTFTKLRGGNVPYPFADWSTDNRYFRYTVNHKSGATNKRIIVSELSDLLSDALVSKLPVNRTLFERLCPVTSSDGPCGFAVIASIIQTLGIGRYGGSKTGIRITDYSRLQDILSHTH